MHKILICYTLKWMKQVENVENFKNAEGLEGRMESYSHSYPHYPQDVDNSDVDNWSQYKTNVLWTYHKSVQRWGKMNKAIDI